MEPHQLLPPNPKLAPKYKIQGISRKTRQIYKTARQEIIKNPEEDYFAGWHWHPAIFEPGAVKNWKLRERLVIDAACMSFLSIAEELKEKDYRRPHQLWITCHSENPDYDAIHIHTTSPEEETTFPVRPKATWGINKSLEKYFSEKLYPYKIHVGEGMWNTFDEDYEEKIYYIYSPEVGIPIEQ